MACRLEFSAAAMSAVLPCLVSKSTSAPSSTSVAMASTSWAATACMSGVLPSEPVRLTPAPHSASVRMVCTYAGLVAGEARQAIRGDAPCPLSRSTTAPFATSART
eukprot:1414270-Pyramimonas_sp.AAC.1